jgi:hypothetical protein
MGPPRVRGLLCAASGPDRGREAQMEGVVEGWWSSRGFDTCDAKSGGRSQRFLLPQRMGFFHFRTYA